MESIVQHLKRRHLDIDLHRPVIDEEHRIATFYLWNLSGGLVGYQQYRPEGEKKPQNNPNEGKYFTHRKLPTIAVWGVETLHLTPHIVFVTEGIFDAARITERGYSAIAVLSNNPTSDFRNWLTCLNRRSVAVCDNDAAGRRLAKFGDVAVFTEEHDLGDSDDQYVTKLLTDFGK